MRLSPIEKLDTDQQHLLESIVGPDSETVPPPFLIWAHNMAAAPWVEGLGKYCRDESTLDPRLRQLSVLVPAVVFRCAAAWNAHLEEAIGLGVSADALAGLARDGHAEFGARDEQLLVDFGLSILREHHVPISLYEAARDEFGEAGLVDVIAALGSFSISCMALITFDVPINAHLADPFGAVGETS